MYDNALSHVSKLSLEFFKHKRFTGEKIVEWPPSSPDLNPTENLWSMVKKKLYEGGKTIQQQSRPIGRKLKTTILEVEPAEVKKITKLMVYRLLAIIEKKSHYIKMKKIQSHHMCWLFVLL